MYCIVRIILLSAALLSPVPALAGFHVCNDTTEPHEIAFSQRVDGTWQSQGWWQIRAGDCRSVVEQDLTNRFFYLRVKGQDTGLHHASVKFCASNGPFSGYGSTACQTQRLRPLDFARINVGKGTSDWTVKLSELVPHSSQQNAGPTDLDTDKPRVIRGVFQSCVPAPRGEGQICTFVGTKKEFITHVDDDSPKGVTRTLKRLHPGAPVTLRARITHNHLGSKEVNVLLVERRPADIPHQMLVDLQGTWVSERDPNDQFTVDGATRVNAYAGIETAEEFFAVADHCQDYTFEGYAIHSWNKDDAQGICYQVDALSKDHLTLKFLPSGRILSYVRPPNS